MGGILSVSDRQQLRSAMRRKVGLFKPYICRPGLRLQFMAAQEPRYWRRVQ